MNREISFETAVEFIHAAAYVILEPPSSSGKLPQLPRDIEVVETADGGTPREVVLIFDYHDTVVIQDTGTFTLSPTGRLSCNGVVGRLALLTPLAIIA